MLDLRDYQVDQLDRVRERLRLRIWRICAQAATGAGKTVMIAHLLKTATTKGKRGWFICHRRELVEQSAARFREAADLEAGIILAGERERLDAPIQVCAIQSLVRRLERLPKPDYLIWDECHHLAAETWARVAAAYRDVPQIGLTATPARLDGRGLAPYFDCLVPGPSTADLIDQGWLSPYRLFAPGTPPDLSRVRTVAGEYDQGQLADVLTRAKVVGSAVMQYQTHCPAAQALCFLYAIQASEELAARFTAAGIVAAHLDGGTPRTERHDVIDRFRRGEIRVLSSVDLFSEGLDVPAVDAVFLLRPTQSLALYLQQVGRGLRPAPGKDHVTIFDHVGNWQRHGRPDDPRVWSLEGIEHPAREGLPPAKRCPACFAVVPAACLTCPECGEVFKGPDRPLVDTDDDLVEIAPETRRLEERSCQTFADWQRLGHLRGYKPGWAHIRFRLQQQRRRERFAR